MKKKLLNQGLRYCFLFLIFCFSASVLAQTNDIVVYSEKGELFTLYVNSVIQNDPPESNVRARNISGDSYTIRVQMADPNIPELTQRYWTEEKNVDITFIIRKNNKGKWFLVSGGETPRSKEQSTSGTSYREPQTNPDSPHREPQNIPDLKQGNEVDQIDQNTNVKESTMKLKTDIGQESVNINMTVSANSNVTTTTTTTTTSTVSSNPAPQTHSAPVRCPAPTSASDFNKALNTIKSESFENTKITLAKQICKSSCLTTEQLKTLIKSFSFEASRLEMAKYAYEFVFDPDKYYLINDVFDFSNSKTELNKYIESR